MKQQVKLKRQNLTLKMKLFSFCQHSSKKTFSVLFFCEESFTLLKSLKNTKNDFHSKECTHCCKTEPVKLMS
jgi:hypothetical protein